ncbi:MAG: hypothetical protein SFW07_04290 [Gammaproteobacteria bacterium]|nr:hypothetical protein [Gammaproteobacteria bacterium]
MFEAEEDKKQKEQGAIVVASDEDTVLPGVFGLLPDEVFSFLLGYLTMREIYVLGRTTKGMYFNVYDGVFFKHARLPSYLQSDFVQSVRKEINLRRFFADAKEFPIGLRKLACDKKAVDALGQINLQGTVVLHIHDLMEAASSGRQVMPGVFDKVRDNFFKLFPAGYIPVFSQEFMDYITANIVEVCRLFALGGITLAQLAALPSIEHLDIVLSNEQGKALLLKGFMTVEQLGGMSIPRMRFLFRNDARHNIVFSAFEDHVLTGDEVVSMPTDTHVDYLTAQRRTNSYSRKLDGCGIHMIRKGYLSVQQFSQLPKNHLIELFNEQNGQGMYALEQGMIKFDEIMAQPISDLSEEEMVEGKGELAKFVSRKIDGQLRFGC